VKASKAQVGVMRADSQSPMHAMHMNKALATTAPPASTKRIVEKAYCANDV
jgi:hypothetical protein